MLNQFLIKLELQGLNGSSLGSSGNPTPGRSISENFKVTLLLCKLYWIFFYEGINQYSPKKGSPVRKLNSPIRTSKIKVRYTYMQMNF